MKTGGSLLITKEVAKSIQALKKGYCKFYAKHFNILCNQQEYTVAVHRYMLSLGLMGKGDFLCINQDRHEEYRQFDTEVEMRSHWLECHQISLEEIFLMMLVPDPCKEPSMVPTLDLPGVSGAQDNLPGVSGVQDNQSKAKAGKGTGKGKGNKRGGGTGSTRTSKPPSALSALAKMAAVVPPVVSTEKSQSDLLELTNEELEGDDMGESVDGNEKLLSDVD